MTIVDEIQDKLNEHWAGVINFYVIDILKHLITLITIMKIEKDKLLYSI